MKTNNQKGLYNEKNSISTYVRWGIISRNSYSDSATRPYIGAGLNYTRFYHAKSVHPAVTNLQVKKHSFGPVANVGVDVKLTKNIYFNATAWYTHIKTTAKFQALGLDHEVKLKLDPMVYFAGFAVKF